MKFALKLALLASAASAIKFLGEDDTAAPESAPAPASAPAAAPAPAVPQFTVQTTEPGKSGKQCKKDDEATVNYTGKFQDGSVFDSSVGSSEGPFKFNLGQGQVIRCWDAAFMQMSVGEKATLTCPPQVAYGEKGAGDKIPPNTTLFFDVEVIDC